MGRTRSISYIMITMILAMTLSCRVVVAQSDQTSASYVMSGCRDVASLVSFSNVGESKEDRYRMGFCSGIIIGLSYSGKSYGICFPAGTSSLQAANVIVQYIDGRPERTNENFMSLSASNFLHGLCAIHSLACTRPTSVGGPGGLRS